MASFHVRSSIKMSDELIKAHLNLYAVLRNLEDIVEYDLETASLVKDWDVSLQFSVLNGPRACIEFRGGVCRVGRGKYKKPSVRLLFLSPAHLNRMIGGKANPIPIKGFTRLGFLKRDFTRVTEKLEYYLKPTAELLKDEEYLALNTRLTLHTAAFAVREIGLLDPIGRIAASHIGNGSVNLKILPHGPAVCVNFKDGDIEPRKGEADRPMAVMWMKNVKAANDFLSGKTDAFTAIASGDVMIRGQIPMLESLSLILDRIPHYLS
jgi:putative sterol carrier protein